VTDQERGLGTELSDQAADVVREQVDGVGLEALWLRGQVVAARVRDDDAETRRRERRDLQPPPEPELREAVQQNDQRPVTGLDVVKGLITDPGVPPRSSIPSCGTRLLNASASGVGATETEPTSAVDFPNDVLTSSPFSRRRSRSTSWRLVAPVIDPGELTGRAPNHPGKASEAGGGRSPNAWPDPVRRRTA